MPLKYFFIGFLIGFGFFAAPAPKSNLAEALEKIQKAWDSTSAYQSHFKQVIFTKRVGAREESSGILSVIKPGKLRWEATAGPLQILNGNKLILIQTKRRKKNRVVDIYNDVTKQLDTKMLGFLSGKTQFKEWYHSEIVSEKPGSIELKLSPRGIKNPAPQDIFIVEFDKKIYSMLSFTNDTAQNRVRVDFSDTKINPNLESNLFEYIAQPGDIVHNPS